MASHANYPAFRHIFPDPHSRIRALRPFFAATVRDAIPFGGVYATGANDTDQPRVVDDARTTRGAVSTGNDGTGNAGGRNTEAASVTDITIF